MTDMTLLPIHSLAGLLGLTSGAIALSVRKGANLHRKSGLIFVYAMMIVAFTGTVMGALISEMAAVIPGALTFYLVLTSFLTVRRSVILKSFWLDFGAMLIGLIVGIASLIYGFMAEGQPTVIYIFFGAVALLATLGDLRMMARGVQGAHRIARHLWRMCFALFLASISLFVGQSQVFPELIRNSGLLPIPVVMVLLLMFYWLVRVRFSQWYRRYRQQIPANVSASRLAAKSER
jgi:uncharacterized membrane protein